MSFDDFYKRFAAFGLAFALSLFAAAFFYGTNIPNIFKKESKPAPKLVASTNNISRISNQSRNVDSETNEKTAKAPQGITEGVKIISKPRALYTDDARTNLVQGKVVLRVTFSANGEIGVISVISGLPDGLTEQAIAAARSIKFEPAKRDGKPTTVTKPVEYTFTIY